MIDTVDLKHEMCTLFSSLSDFSLEPDEEMELAFTPYPLGSGPMTIERYQDANDVSQIPLAHGPSCEFYVALTDSQTDAPMLVDPQKLLISWRMRERTRGEDSLRQPTGRARGLIFVEPSLVLTNFYPVDDRHVCEASFYFHQSRHPDSRAVR